MARWGRAARLLDLPAGSRVLDIGCAFGYGTAKLARRYRVTGADLSAEYINRARRRVPNGRFDVADAENLPYGRGEFDGVVMLDVLEHVPNPQRAIQEAARVLRPGGVMILSVPNRGLLGHLDALNLYHRLFGDTGPPPTDDPSWERSPSHRHYSLEDVGVLLGGEFQIARTIYSGIGQAEAVNLVLLVVFKRWLRFGAGYALLQYLYFTGYIIEDEVGIGRGSYHLMVRAVRRTERGG